MILHRRLRRPAHLRLHLLRMARRLPLRPRHRVSRARTRGPRAPSPLWDSYKDRLIICKNLEKGRGLYSDTS